MLKKFKLLFYTVKYLKATQVLHQIKYRIIKPRALIYYNKTYTPESICFLSFKKLPPVYTAYLGNNKFILLNQEHFFGTSIDWNYLENGKLWNYNLQYANYLLQQDISFDDKATLMESMFNWLNSGKLPLEPYPVSLRSINVLRWLSNEGKLVNPILENVHAELDFLSKRPEYHLLGNHLLENAFALMMGGAFFSNVRWIKQGQEILKHELQEQIMTDGAHFELSPMYHQIIFFRLLELLDWYSKWPLKAANFESYLTNKAGLMLTWLKNISFKNGDIPHFNDSAEGIAYSTNWLVNYAESLGVINIDHPLRASGYRSIHMGNYECKVDVAQLGPSYQPGHAHADALSFILYYKGRPLFVEKGTSTYQIGEIRTLERSTLSHNTVVIDNKNQSNIWSGFRVAERAKVDILKDTLTEIVAEHNGYKKLGIIHKRRISFKENELEINDEAFGNDNLLKEFHLHIAPGLDVVQTAHLIQISNSVTLRFTGDLKVCIESYEMADGYNRYCTGKKIVVNFVNRLSSKIQFN